MHRFSGFGNLEAISCHFLDLLGSGHRFQTNDVSFGEHAMSSIRNLDTERSLHSLSIFAMSAQRHKERWTGKKETQKQNLRLQNYQILWLSFSIRIFIPLIYIYTYIYIHIISYYIPSLEIPEPCATPCRSRTHRRANESLRAWSCEWYRWRRLNGTLRCSGFLQVLASELTFNKHSISYQTGPNQAESDSHRPPYPLRQQMYTNVPILQHNISNWKHLAKEQHNEFGRRETT